MTRTLDDWLDHQQRQHPKEIELGLDRVRAVAARMRLERPAPIVVTVGGTNGKGSTIAFLEAMLRAAGRRVGAYTSPHLVRYNERVRIDGVDARDDALVAAFERIEDARGDTPLTYFEYGTLAALALFADACVDVALLEVGLGGRLDAVNLVDADAAIVTTVDLDHQDWLGDDREAIGREKAGIFRAGRPAIVGEPAPPASLLDVARATGAILIRAGIDFDVADATDRAWTFTHRDGTRRVLPRPSLEAPAQLRNAAAAIAALHALGLDTDVAALARGVREAAVAARLQRFAGDPELVVDVAHNPQAARELAAWLEREPNRGAVHAVFGLLSDKDAAGIVAALAPRVASWQLAGLDRQTPRGLSAAALRARVPSLRNVAEHADVAAALAAARARAQPGDRIVAFGSFYLCAAILNTRA